MFRELRNGGEYSDIECRRGCREYWGWLSEYDELVRNKGKRGLTIGRDERWRS